MMGGGSPSQMTGAERAELGMEGAEAAGDAQRAAQQRAARKASEKAAQEGTQEVAEQGTKAAGRLGRFAAKLGPAANALGKIGRAAGPIGLIGFGLYDAYRNFKNAKGMKGYAKAGLQTIGDISGFNLGYGIGTYGDVKLGGMAAETMSESGQRALGRDRTLSNIASVQFSRGMSHIEGAWGGTTNKQLKEMNRVRVSEHKHFTEAQIKAHEKELEAMKKFEKVKGLENKSGFELAMAKMKMNKKELAFYETKKALLKKDKRLIALQKEGHKKSIEATVSAQYREGAKLKGLSSAALAGTEDDPKARADRALRTILGSTGQLRLKGGQEALMAMLSGTEKTAWKKKQGAKFRAQLSEMGVDIESAKKLLPQVYQEETLLAGSRGELASGYGAKEKKMWAQITAEREKKGLSTDSSSIVQALIKRRAQERKEGGANIKVSAGDAPAPEGASKQKYNQQDGTYTVMSQIAVSLDVEPLGAAIKDKQHFNPSGGDSAGSTG
jgi:hypothetical protein